MSDQIRIALIIAAVVVIALILYRKRLQRFAVKRNQDGIEAEMTAYAPVAKGDPTNAPIGQAKTPSVNIRRNRLFGWGNKIEIERDDTNVEKNTQLGVNQEITAKSDKPSRKK